MIEFVTGNNGDGFGGGPGDIVVILRGGFTKNEGLALRGRPSFTYFTYL